MKKSFLSFDILGYKVEKINIGKYCDSYNIYKNSDIYPITIIDVICGHIIMTDGPLGKVIYEKYVGYDKRYKQNRLLYYLTAALGFLDNYNKNKHD